MNNRFSFKLDYYALLWFSIQKA